MSRVAKTFIVIATVAASTFIAGCSSASSRCGVGTESPEDGVHNFLTSVVENDADLACTILPAGSTSEQVQQEIDHYRAFSLTAEDINKVTGEQLGSGYSASLKLPDTAEEIALSLSSEMRGRWIWATRYWTLTPETYDVP